MINTLTTEVWVHLSWFRFPSTIQLVQNQLITKQATFNDVNKTNWLKPITSTPTVFYFRQLSSSANITSLLGNINWTQIQQYMTKEAEFLSQTNRSESKKNRKQGEGRSFSSKQMKSNLRLPVTAQNVLIVLYSIIIGLGLVTNTAILLAFFKNKVREIFFENKVSKVFFKNKVTEDFFKNKVGEVFFSRTRWVRCSSKTRRVRFSQIISLPKLLNSTFATAHSEDALK